MDRYVMKINSKRKDLMYHKKRKRKIRWKIHFEDHKFIWGFILFSILSATLILTLCY